MSKEEKLSTQLGRFEKEQNRTFRSENIITKIKEPMNMVNKWLDSAEERLSKLEDRAKIGRERQSERERYKNVLHIFTYVCCLRYNL